MTSADIEKNLNLDSESVKKPLIANKHKRNRTKSSKQYEDSKKKSPIKKLTHIVLKHRSRSYENKLKIYCALHRPVGLANMYHYFVLMIVVISCVIFNVFLNTIFSMFLLDFNSIHLMAFFDIILIVILLSELIMRLWSCSCVQEYQGLKGKLNYLKSYGFKRGLDITGLITFIITLTLILNESFYGTTSKVLKILHLLQIFQFYRISFRILRLMSSTVLTHLNAICISFILALLVLLFCAFAVFLFEKEKNKDIDNIFDAIWWGVITLSTIGYGDRYPITTMGKILTCIFVIAGVSMFALPANIFGTGLAIRVQEQQKKFLDSRISAKLILHLWRCYDTNDETRDSEIWSHYAKNITTINENDKIALRFILTIKYLITRRQFKMLLHSQTDDLDLIELKENIEHIATEISKIKNTLSEMNKKAKTENIDSKTLLETENS